MSYVLPFTQNNFLPINIKGSNAVSAPTLTSVSLLNNGKTELVGDTVISGGVGIQSAPSGTYALTTPGKINANGGIFKNGVEIITSGLNNPDKSNLTETIYVNTSSTPYYWVYGTASNIIFQGTVIQQFHLPQVATINLGTVINIFKPQNLQIYINAPSGYTFLDENNDTQTQMIIYTTNRVITLTAINITGSIWAITYSQSTNSKINMNLGSFQVITGTKQFNTLPTTTVATPTLSTQLIPKIYADSTYVSQTSPDIGKVSLTLDDTGNIDYFLTFAPNPQATNNILYYDNGSEKLMYNPNAQTLYCKNLSGQATTSTQLLISSTYTAGTYNIPFFSSITGTATAYGVSTLSYNTATSTFSATNLIGNGSGITNISTTNIPGLSNYVDKSSTETINGVKSFSEFPLYSGAGTPTSTAFITKAYGDATYLLSTSPNIGKVNLTQTDTANNDYYLTFAKNPTATNNSLFYNSTIPVKYNSSTNTLTATNLIGNGSGITNISTSNIPGLSNYVDKSSTETINGVKSFSEFPLYSGAGTPTSTAFITKAYADATYIGSGISLSGTNAWTGLNSFDVNLPTSTQTPTTSTQLVPKGWVDSNFVSTVDKSKLMQSTIITATANGQYYWNFGDPQLMVFLTNAGPININLPNVLSASNIGATFTVKKNNQQINAIAAAGFTLINESNQVLSTAIIGFSTVQVVSFTAISTTGSQWCVSYSQGPNFQVVATLQNGQTFVSGAKTFNTNTTFGATYSMTINAQATYNTVLPTTTIISVSSSNQFVPRIYLDNTYYTQTQSNANYYTKTFIDANYYTQTQSDANYYTKTFIDANYYTQTQSNANYYTKTFIDANYYTQTQSNANYYTKTQSDTNFVNTIENQSISGLKSFTSGSIVLSNKNKLSTIQTAVSGTSILLEFETPENVVIDNVAIVGITLPAILANYNVGTKYTISRSNTGTSGITIDAGTGYNIQSKSGLNQSIYWSEYSTSIILLCVSTTTWNVVIDDFVSNILTTDSVSNATFYPSFFPANINGGYQNPITSSSLSYNPSNGLLSAITVQATTALKQNGLNGFGGFYGTTAGTLTLSFGDPEIVVFENSPAITAVQLPSVGSENIGAKFTFIQRDINRNYNLLSTSPDLIYDFKRQYSTSTFACNGMGSITIVAVITGGGTNAWAVLTRSDGMRSAAVSVINANFSLANASNLPIRDAYSVSNGSTAITITLPTITLNNLGLTIVFRRVATATATVSFVGSSTQNVFNTALVGGTTAQALMPSTVYLVRLTAMVTSGTTYAWYSN